MSVRVGVGGRRVIQNKMKVKLIGIMRRETTTKTGQPVTYSTLHFSKAFDEYSKQNSVCLGLTAGSVQTTLDTSFFKDGDEVNIEYEPTGFKDRNGSEQFRIADIYLAKQPK